MSTDSEYYTAGFDGYLAGEDYMAILTRLELRHPRRDALRQAVERGYTDARKLDRETAPVRS